MKKSKLKMGMAGAAMMIAAACATDGGASEQEYVPGGNNVQTTNNTSNDCSEVVYDPVYVKQTDKPPYEIFETTKAYKCNSGQFKGDIIVPLANGEKSFYTQENLDKIKSEPCREHGWPRSTSYTTSSINTSIVFPAYNPNDPSCREK